MGKQIGKMAKVALCLALIVGVALAAPQQQRAAPAGRKPLSQGANTGRRLLAVGVTSISPTYGPMEGNSLVMVTGTDFNSIAATAVKECQFGTSKTTATVINNTHISCRTPKHSTGAATFTLHAPSAVSATLPSPSSPPCSCPTSRHRPFCATTRTPVPSSMCLCSPAVVASTGHGVLPLASTTTSMLPPSVPPASWCTTDPPARS